MRDLIPTFAPEYGYEERSAIMSHIAHDILITSNYHVKRFERRFGNMFKRRAIMVNSGSSALYIAVKAMGWKPRTRVATCALAFPTTVAAIVNNGHIPVFVDCDVTYNADPFQLKAVAEKGVGAAVLAHMVGNTLNPVVFSMFRDTVEDACDAIGSSFGNTPAGQFGSISCFSTYMAHHMGTGEGGVVCTKNNDLYDKMLSYVNWGRSCLCRPGEDNVCGKRMEYEVDGVPYDHKYIAWTLGGNFKPMELSGVLGNIQINKLPLFKEIRNRNFSYLLSYFADLTDYVSLPMVVEGADPCWFAFPLTLRKGDRADICKRIEARGVQTRLMYTGNILRHPAMDDVEHEAPYPLDNCNNVMENTFMVGLGQTVSPAECEKVAQVVKEEVVR